MRAVVVDAFGDSTVLSEADRPVPLPFPDEVAIDVAFAGVGFIDTLVRSGTFDFMKPPFVPGIEVSGIVRAVGSDFTRFSIGQRVAALLTDFSRGGMGGYAEIACARAALTVPLTPREDLATAAATIANGTAAFLASAKQIDGSDVVISGASGGLGRCLVVAAARNEADRIVAVCRSRRRSAELLRLGATEVVSPEEFAADDSSFDAAYDTVGGDTRLALLTKLKPTGRLVLLGNASGQDRPISGDDIWLRSISVEGFSVGGISQSMPDRISEAASEALAASKLRPISFDVLDLGQASEAHRMVEAGEGPGKIVLKIG